MFERWLNQHLSTQEFTHRRAGQLHCCRQGITIAISKGRYLIWQMWAQSRKYNLIYWSEHIYTHVEMKCFVKSNFTYICFCCYVFHLCAHSLTSDVTVANVMFICIYLCCVYAVQLFAFCCCALQDLLH